MTKRLTHMTDICKAFLFICLLALPALCFAFGPAIQAVVSTIYATSGAQSFTYIGVVNNSATPSGTTIDSSSTLNIASGDLLVAVIAWEDVTTTVSVATTSSSNSMTCSQGSQGGAKLAICYKLNATEESTATLRATYADTSPYRAIQVAQFRPTDGASVTLSDGPSFNGETTSSTPTSGSISITASATNKVVAVYGNKTYNAKDFFDCTIFSSAVDGMSEPNTYSVLTYSIVTSNQTGVGECTLDAATSAVISGIVAFK